MKTANDPVENIMVAQFEDAEDLVMFLHNMSLQTGDPIQVTGVNGKPLTVKWYGNYPGSLIFE